MAFRSIRELLMAANPYTKLRFIPAHHLAHTARVACLLCKSSSMLVLTLMLVTDEAVHHYFSRFKLAAVSGLGIQIKASVMCAKRGHEALQLLTLLGSDLDVDGDNGQTAMHRAALENNCAVIDCLLAAGALLQPRSNLGTPLAIAVKSKHLEATRLLLSRGADPYAQGSHCQCAMKIAQGQGASEILTLLLQSTANIPDPFAESTDDSAYTSTSFKQLERAMAGMRSS